MEEKLLPSVSANGTSDLANRQLDLTILQRRAHRPLGPLGFYSLPCLLPLGSSSSQ